MEAGVGLQPTEGTHTHTQVPREALGFDMFVKFFKPNMARDPLWNVRMGAGTGLSAFHKRTQRKSRAQSPTAQIKDTETQKGLCLSPHLPIPSSLGSDVLSGALAATLDHEATVDTASQTEGVSDRAGPH